MQTGNEASLLANQRVEMLESGSAGNIYSVNIPSNFLSITNATYQTPGLPSEFVSQKGSLGSVPLYNNELIIFKRRFREPIITTREPFEST